MTNRLKRYALQSLTRSSIALLACSVIAPALAQSTREYPQRPIRVVIPYAPGGGSDILARFLAPRIAVDLGQQIVIDNRPGGSAMIGTHIMARAAPDGYTLGVIDSAFMINPALYKKMSYDALKDFAPITLFASSPLAGGASVGAGQQHSGADRARQVTCWKADLQLGGQWNCHPSRARAVPARSRHRYHTRAVQGRWSVRR